MAADWQASTNPANLVLDLCILEGSQLTAFVMEKIKMTMICWSAHQMFNFQCRSLYNRHVHTTSVWPEDLYIPQRPDSKMCFSYFISFTLQY